MKDSNTSNISNNNHALGGLNESERLEFGAMLRARRQELGLSIVQLEQRTGINNGRLSRWERGIQLPARPERLKVLAKGLELPASDLYAAAGIDLTGDRPSVRPYLRSKYGDRLPPDAIADIEAYARKITDQYGITDGPAPGQDE